MKRVLVWGLTNRRAGTEAVIENIVKSIGDEACFDFLTMEDVPNYADITGGANGVVVMPDKRASYLRYRRAMRGFFAEHAEEYDAAWINLNILNNIDALRLSWQYEIPKVILHSHNAGNDGRLHQRVLCAINKHAPARYATDFWACSEYAGSYMFGGREFTVIPNAIDMQRFRFDEVNRIRVRDQLGLGSELVVGTVGRLVEQKNHAFLIKVLKQLIVFRPDTKLIIAGDGALRADLEQLAGDYGISRSVIFLGECEDIPSILSAFDIFVLPSLFEGLPVSVLEAQANGLPCVISSSVSSECIISSSVRQLPLHSPKEWAEAIEACPVERRPPDSLRAEEYDLANIADFVSSMFELKMQ